MEYERESKKPKSEIPDLKYLYKHEENSPPPHLLNYPIISYKLVQKLYKEWSIRSPKNRMQLKQSVYELLSETNQTGAWIYKKDDAIDAEYTKFSPICTWDVSKVTDMSGIFEGACNFNENLNDWNVSNVENMKQMFSGASEFNNGSSNKLMWDVAKVEDMEQMFYKAYNFNNQLTGTDGESGWDVSNVTDMDRMFYQATSFNNGEKPHVHAKPLNWKISTNTTTEQMFYEARSLSLEVMESIEKPSA